MTVFLLLFMIAQVERFGKHFISEIITYSVRMDFINLFLGTHTVRRFLTNTKTQKPGCE